MWLVVILDGYRRRCWLPAFVDWTVVLGRDVLVGVSSAQAVLTWRNDNSNADGDDGGDGPWQLRRAANLCRDRETSCQDWLCTRDGLHGNAFQSKVPSRR
jgi:hypothetical protein